MLPDSWIERIFDRMSGLYGAKFADLWRGTDPIVVRRTWAEKLAGFASMPKAIAEALDALDSKPFPPTLPEFLALCREAALRHQHDTPRIEHKPTPEEQARAEEARKKAAQAISHMGDKRNHRQWVDRLIERQRNGERLSLIQLDAICEAQQAEVEA